MNKLFNSLERLKQGIVKTKNYLFYRLTQILHEETVIDENLIEQIREILYQSDIGFVITERLIDKIKSINIDNSVNNIKEEILRIIKNELAAILRISEKSSSKIDFENFEILDVTRPKIILIVGVNGTGKTTSIGKMAYNFRQNNYKVLIAAADTFRAAANEQLAIWADKSSVEIIENKQTKDPGAVVYEAIDKAIKKSLDILLIDTAGRLHTKTNLMNELNKIYRVIEKKLNRKPDEIFLVVDATFGQNALSQIENFLKYIELTGIILTKLDGTAKGGVIFQIVEKYKIPVKFIGIGEDIKDLQPFNSENFINAIFEIGKE